MKEKELSKCCSADIIVLKIPPTFTGIVAMRVDKLATVEFRCKKCWKFIK